MIDPIQFERWTERHFSQGGVLDTSPESRILQKTMVEAVMCPEVTILSRAVAQTGIDEIQARATLALVHAFENWCVLNEI
ncbi:MAG: hypothetical protein ACRYFU_19010 [Janthinobacterium lividum]